MLRSSVYLSRFLLENSRSKLLSLSLTANDVTLPEHIQGHLLSFYEDKYTTPYVPVQAEGPWVRTSENKIVYDAGGYGMLGLGHNPSSVLEAMSKPQVMANVMTPQLSQYEFSEAMMKEMGPKKPYSHFMCLNSGSEANTLALRIANIRPFNGRNVKICLKKSFHGRTDAPARVSDSSRKSYVEDLADYKDPCKINSDIYVVRPNDIDHFLQTLDMIQQRDEKLEIMLMEPVMGEGEPGLAITPEFYNVVREETEAMNALLLVDSVQAGFRCQGHLSITSYPGFEASSPPDMETFSKALNAGQFPMSTLAVSQNVADRFKTGLYGNTMTANPRALDVATAVLHQMTPEVKRNIVTSGDYLKRSLTAALGKYDFVEKVTGTGLLIAVHFSDHLDCAKVERDLRLRGLNMIHGGRNAIRMTPWFLIDELECNLIVDMMDDYLKDV